MVKSHIILVPLTKNTKITENADRHKWALNYKWLRGHTSIGLYHSLSFCTAEGANKNLNEYNWQHQLYPIILPVFPYGLSEYEENQSLFEGY